MKLNSLKKYPLIITFGTLVLVFSIIDIIKPNKSISEFENRPLTQRPKFEIKSILSNDFSNKYDKYINDQFIFRNGFINLKSISEISLGKIENNGITYGSDGYMFEKQLTIDKERLDKNTIALKDFIEKYNKDLTFMLIPNSYVIYSEKLHMGLNQINQEELINETYKFYHSLNKSNLSLLNIIDTLKNNKDQYIYYKTDHHWTTYGAYLAYKDFVLSKSLNPIEFNKLKLNRVDNFYGTYFSKSKLFNASSDFILYNVDNNLKVTIDNVEYDSVYDIEKFNGSDKYSAFLRGNNGLTILRNHEIGESRRGSKILVIKDSFANSFVEFLTFNYEEVHIIDLRKYMESFNHYIEDKNFDDILVMYNFNNFATDINVSRLKY